MNISVLMFIYGNELCCSGKILQPSRGKKKGDGCGGACYLEAGIEESGLGPNEDLGCLV